MEDGRVFLAFPRETISGNCVERCLVSTESLFAEVEVTVRTSGRCRFSRVRSVMFFHRSERCRE